MSMSFSYVTKHNYETCWSFLKFRCKPRHKESAQFSETNKLCKKYSEQCHSETEFANLISS